MLVILKTNIQTAGSVNGEAYIWVEKFCVDFWVAPELDAYWKAARAFSIIAVTIGAYVVLLEN
jgi:hypothetical protein